MKEVDDAYRDAAQLIANTVNAGHPGRATFRELPRINHHFARYKDARDAYAEKNGVTDAGPAVDAILEWLSRIGMR